jgi:capsular polysaccharide biosynthesis protein
MDLLDSIRILMRRWWLTVPLLVITLGGVVAGVVMLPWKYKSEATVVLLSSRLQAKQTGGNPWLAFDSSLTVTAEVVGREIMDARTTDSLRKQGNTAGYKVGIAADSTGPVLVIEVEGPNRQVTQNTLNAVLRLIPARLEDIQNQGAVVPYARIRPDTVAASTQPQLVVKDKIRTLLMALFAGLVVTIGVPLFAESLAVRRRRSGLAPDDDYSSPDPFDHLEKLNEDAAPSTVDSAVHKNGNHRPAPVKEEWEPYLPPERPRDPRRAGPRP